MLIRCYRDGGRWLHYFAAQCVSSNDRQQLQMGNDATKGNQRDTLRRRGYTNKSIDEEPSRKAQFSTLNHSLEASPAPVERYQSLDFQSNSEDSGSLRSEKRRRREEVERDQVLHKLSQKNEELRRQLKKISDELTEQLKHKKFVPKRKPAEGEEDEKERINNAAGIRRELDNGYRQIEMYKRTIEALRGKQEKDQSDARIKRLQNTIATIDSQIADYIRKVEGLKKVTKVQDKVLQKDLNEDLVGGVSSFKKEAEEMKNQLKELQKRERQREVNYKRQQAYLFEVEKKWRQMNGDYFPELKKKQQQLPLPPTSSRAKEKTQSAGGVPPKEFAEALEELAALKGRHEEYHKRIDGAILQKNKLAQEQAAVQENVKYSDRVIEALRLRLKEINKIYRPTRKSLFGYDSRNNDNGTELLSEYNGGVDEIEREIQEQYNQDKFDIKHLIANIPKPARPKVVIEFEERPGKALLERRPSIARDVSEQGGMIISGEKSQPKKWGSAMTRVEEKGRPIRKESAWDDKGTWGWPADAKPLIIGINIWVNKNNAIMGIQAIYLHDEEIRYGVKSSSSADGFLQRYDLQNPDSLKNLTGSFSAQGFLEYLVLYSRQGKVGTFGSKHQGQEQFTFGLSSSERPFRLFGASFIYDGQPRVNRLGIEVCQEG